jgi:hypothetical protein
MPVQRPTPELADTRQSLDCHQLVQCPATDAHPVAAARFGRSPRCSRAVWAHRGRNARSMGCVRGGRPSCAPHSCRSVGTPSAGAPPARCSGRDDGRGRRNAAGDALRSPRPKWRATGPWPRSPRDRCAVRPALVDTAGRAGSTRTRPRRGHHGSPVRRSRAPGHPWTRPAIPAPRPRARPPPPRARWSTSPRTGRRGAGPEDGARLPAPPRDWRTECAGSWWRTPTPPHRCRRYNVSWSRARCHPPTAGPTVMPSHGSKLPQLVVSCPVPPREPCQPYG